jgi:molybdopterin biosynthesis enzyme MoaB
MKLTIETPSGKTLQQHLSKYFGKRTETKLSKEDMEDIANTVRSVMKRCAVVVKDNDGNLIDGVML